MERQSLLPRSGREGRAAGLPLRLGLRSEVLLRRAARVDERGLDGMRVRGEPGFTLVELLTVIAIIGLLVGLLVPVVLAARGRGQKSEAAITLENLRLALRNMKDHYRYDDLLGKDEDGVLVPELIAIGRELDPFNKALGWNGLNPGADWGKAEPGWAPHLNMRIDPLNTEKRICKRFYTAKRARISNYRLVDPWRKPYIYDIVTRQQDVDGDGEIDDIDVELLMSMGPDCIRDTDDDIIVEADRRRRPVIEVPVE